MTIWQGLTPDEVTAVNTIWPQAMQPEMEITCTRSSAGFTISRQHDQITVAFADRTMLMRAVALLQGQLRHPTDFSISQQPHFKVMAAMLDVARNGVPTLTMLKQTIQQLAKMGYNELWLYLEDLFEVPEYPYFGRQRGRYTAEQLHEIAEYGDALGVTVVPAIQTLAHLHNALKWDAFAAIKDTDDTLLVDAPETAQFLRAILRAASAPFTTSKIHIGMDEAYQLGRGRYLDQQGYTDQQTLILKQLRLVVALCRQLHLVPSMWSDLWFTFASPKHEMYDPDVHFDAAFKASLPPVSQVYWDYYHEDEATYRARFAQHFELSDQVVFAGGLWTWGALAPDQSKMLRTIKAGLTAARTSGVQQVVATMWFDDGAEVPLSAAWYGLQAFASYMYHDHVTPKLIDAEFAQIQGEDPTFYQLLDAFDNFTGDVNAEADNVSKILLYEDLLLQRFEANLSHVDVVSQYLRLRDQLRQVQVLPKHRPMLAYYTQLATTLLAKSAALKAVAHLRDPNVADPKGALVAIQTLQAELKRLLSAARELWQTQRRGQGFEIIDLRLGAQIARCETVSWRIQAFMRHEDRLAELTEPLLAMDQKNRGLVGHALYHEIISADAISF